MTRVVLRGLPVRAFVQLNVHIDDVVRELDLVQLGASSSAVAAEIGGAAREILSRCAAPRQEGWQQAERAAAQGRTRVDLVLDLPPGADGSVQDLASLLDQTDELSRGSHLLIPPSPSEMVALRRWLCGEIAAQVGDGAAPSSCPV